jgi:hypothetical protein
MIPILVMMQPLWAIFDTKINHNNPNWDESTKILWKVGFKIGGALIYKITTWLSWGKHVVEEMSTSFQFLSSQDVCLTKIEILERSCYTIISDRQGDGGQ